MSEDVERLVGGGERDPMVVNREAGNENGEIKIDPGKRGQTEGDGEEIQSVHAKLSARSKTAATKMTKPE
jgi:hypothetical protein